MKPTVPETTQRQAEQRTQSYRAAGLQHRAVPHILFQFPFLICPWDGCGHQIAGIDFQLERFGDDELHNRLMNAWWSGPGLTGRCPGCGNHVLFTLNGKQAVAPDDVVADSLLPDGWHQFAYVL